MMEGKSTATFQAEYSEKISRLFIFRFLWVFVMMWPLFVWTFWMSIVAFIQFWHMLILGKRSKNLWEREVRFVRHMTKWQSYFKYLTDKRPEFIEA